MHAAALEFAPAAVVIRLAVIVAWLILIGTVMFVLGSSAAQPATPNPRPQSTISTTP